MALTYPRDSKNDLYASGTYVLAFKKPGSLKDRAYYHLHVFDEPLTRVGVITWSDALGEYALYPDNNVILRAEELGEAALFMLAETRKRRDEMKAIETALIGKAQ